MGHGPQLTEAEQVRACQLKAAGKSTMEIATTIGRSETSVHRLVNRDDSKAIIEQETAKLLRKLPQITGIIQRDLDTADRLSKFLAGESPEGEGKTLLEKDLPALLKFRDQTNKTISEILKAMGIFSAHAPGMIIQQIYEDKRTQVISPEILRALGGYLDQSTAGSEFPDSEEWNMEEEVIVEGGEESGRGDIRI